MTHSTWTSPLGGRYASAAMLALWSAQRRHSTWRRLWLELARAERELGAGVPGEALEQMADHLDDIDFDAVALYEERFRHDVMAHIHAFGDAAPAARGVIHLGATSCFVTDNTDLILMRAGMALLRDRIVSVLGWLAAFAARWRGEPALGYTHLQPAQLTTVGKRATLWMFDLVLDLAEIDRRIETLPFRGVKGTTGTQASFLELFGGDEGKVRELDRRVTAAMGFRDAVPVSGQTYSRKIDAQVLGAVAGVAASAAKFAGDIRMLQSFGEMAEPFEAEQVGSSAMAWKRNPMRCERINGLARYAASLEPNANQTHAAQYFERTLDDSANRRLVIPEMFLAVDAILVLQAGVTSGLEVHPARIAARLADELPFMATEALLLRAVAAGVGRQEAHEMIRRHALAAVRAGRETGAANDLLQRLAGDPGWPLGVGDVEDALRADRFVGRAPQQVDEFLDEVVRPLLGASREGEPEAEVRV